MSKEASERVNEYRSNLYIYKLLHKLIRRVFPSDQIRFWKNRDHIVQSNGWRLFFKPFYLYSQRRILARYNAGIPSSEHISPFTTPHGLTGIFISNGAFIGEGCTIFQQVTIGSNTLLDSKRAGAPTIGRNVYIGAGAKIIGNVSIGDGVRIGANCVITSDVPANATVVSSPPRIIYHAKPRDNTFVNWNAYLREKNFDSNS